MVYQLVSGVPQGGDPSEYTPNTPQAKRRKKAGQGNPTVSSPETLTPATGAGTQPAPSYGSSEYGYLNMLPTLASLGDLMGGGGL
ncbi:MAG: hypothetical protein ACREQ4_01135 [Candidatus Binataceae bacterium]